jgi:hypothetical protein
MTKDGEWLPPPERGRSVDAPQRSDPSVRSYLCSLLCILSLSTGCYAWPYNIRPHTYAAALGDLDGDGDLDAYLANGRNEGVVRDTVWFNDGTGRFDSCEEQELEAETHAIVLGDLDSDGDLDAVIDLAGAATVAFNDGSGTFAYQRRHLGVEDSGAFIYAPASGDLDGDGDLDLVLGGCCGATGNEPGEKSVLHSFNMVWLNDGHGRFQDTGQRLGVFGTVAVSLGDLDADGDLDIFDANSSSIVEDAAGPDRNQPNCVWLNDGHGRFTDSGQRLGSEESRAVALGDLDGDGDLDAFVANRTTDRVWLNDSLGHFAAGDWEPKQGGAGSVANAVVTLDDLDSDGDLDALSAGRGFVEVWYNQAAAQAGEPAGLERSQRIRHSIWSATAVGDVDGDRDQDIFVGLLDRETRMWVNDGAGRFAEK